MEPDSQCFTVTWRIENFDFFFEREDEKYSSPSFVIESLQDTAWNLEIYAKLSKSKECVLFYLNRVSGPKPNYKMKYEICFFADDSSPFYEGYSHIDLDWGYSKGLHVPYHKFYIKKGNAFLPPKTLTIRCRTYTSKDSVTNVKNCFIRTRVRVERKAFIGVLEKFSSLVPDEKRVLSMKSSSTEEPSLTLILSLVGDQHCEENVWIEIIPVKKNYIKLCKCELLVLDSAGTKTECGKSEILYGEEELQEWKFPLNFTKGDIMKTNTVFLSNDTLVLKCEFAFSTGIEYEEIEDSEIGTLAISDQSQPRTFPSALEDMFRLYNEGILSDAKLQTQTETFHVHKNILSARSSEFKRIFITDVSEKTTDCVNIEDLEADTVRRMLKFLYSDKLEDLDWESAKNLYLAADKYNIEALKYRCSDFLMNNLQPSESCDLLLFSDRHQDEELKKAVQGYIAEHEEVLQSYQWENLGKSNSLLTTETFQALYLRKWKK